MMSQTAEFRYGKNDTLQVLELPYAGGGLSMLVLLPVEVEGLSRVEAELNAENLHRWTHQLSKREVIVQLPKFKMTSEFELGGMLAGMGMPDAFSKAADFSGMDGSKTLQIAAVIHKAFVDVNEEGTEAAAATAVVMKITAIAEPPPVFRADHPFLFVIRHNASGSILFMGRVENPS